MYERKYRLLFLLWSAALLPIALFVLTRPAAAAGTGSITIVVEGDPAPEMFDFYGAFGTWQLNIGDPFVRTELDAGSYNLFESIKSGYVVSISCDSAFSDIGDSNNAGVAVAVADGQDVTCTVSNAHVGGTITIITASNPAGLSGIFHYGDIGSFTQGDGDSHTSSILLPDSYTVYEDKPAGYLVSAECNTTNIEIIDGPNNFAISMTLTANEAIVCTINNVKNSGKISVIAEGADNLSFYGDFGQFTLNDGESVVFDNLTPDGYDIFQTMPAGYLTEIDCGSAESTDISEGINAGRRVIVTAQADIICTATNTDVGGSITVIAAGDGLATPYNYFGAFGIFPLNVGEIFSSTTLYPGDYDIFQEIETGYGVELTCDSAISSDIGDNNNAGVRVALAANEDVLCTAQNTYLGGSITIITTGEGMADPFTYFGTFNQFSQTVGISVTYSFLLPGNYDIYQDVPPAYISSVSCDAPFVDLSSANDIGAQVTVQSFEHITCIFDNDDLSGRMTVVATGDAGVAPFAFSGDLGTFSLHTGESFVVERVVPGQVAISETIAAGFEVVVSCAGGTSNDQSSLGMAGINATVVTDADVICTFDHTDVGSTITVVAASDPLGLTGIEFFGDLGVFTLDDAGSLQSEPLYAGEYTISQNAITGYLLDIACTGTTATTSVNSVTVDLAANQAIVCTFTSSSEGGDDVVVNGDFELGQYEGWQEYSRRQLDIVVDSNAYGGTIDPLNGDHLAWLGGARWERSYLWQWVTLPAGQAATLEFNYEIRSNDWCGFDWATAYVFDGTQAYLLWYKSLCNYNETAGWQMKSADLSAFAGQTIAIAFFAANDWSYHSSFFVDDVSVIGGGALGRNMPSRAAFHSLDIANLDAADALALDQAYLIEQEGQDVKGEFEVEATENANRLPDDATAVALSNTVVLPSNSVAVLISLAILLVGLSAVVVRGFWPKPR